MTSTLPREERHGDYRIAGLAARIQAERTTTRRTQDVHLRATEKSESGIRASSDAAKQASEAACPLIKMDAEFREERVIHYPCGAAPYNDSGALQSQVSSN
jgi:hypothetical protein